MKKFNLILAMALVAIFTFSVSCEKEDDTDSNLNLSNATDSTTALLQTTAEDDANVNEDFDDIDDEAEDVVVANESSLKSAVEGDTTGRTVVKTVNTDGTKTITITYTNFSNKRRPDRVKNGVITILVEGKWNTIGYKRTLNFKNFTINEAKIEGTKVIEKTAENTYISTLTKGKVTFSDSSTYTREARRTTVKKEGIATLKFIWDDVYEISGSASGVNRKGNAYTHEITSPLVKKMDYKFIVKGVVEMLVNNKKLTLDYGDGTMDRVATVTIDGKTKTITLRK